MRGHLVGKIDATIYIGGVTNKRTIRLQGPGSKIQYSSSSSFLGELQQATGTFLVAMTTVKSKRSFVFFLNNNRTTY